MAELNSEQRSPAHNSTYPKVAVQWFNQALCVNQSLYLVDSEVLRNRHLRVAANRYLTYKNNEVNNQKDNYKYKGNQRPLD